MKKKVCVLLTCFNHIEYIESCIESLLSQSYSDFDIYMFDDCSLDGSYELVRDRYPSVQLFRNQVNKGFIETLNFAKAQIPNEYEYVFRVDSDDIYHKDAISILVNHAEIYNLDVVGSSIESFGSESQIYNFPLVHNEIVNALLLGSPITHSGVIIRNEIYKRINYDKKFIYCEDYNLWVDINKDGGKFGNVSNVLLKYRKHENNATKKTLNIEVVNLLTDIRLKHCNYIKRHDNYELIKNLYSCCFIDCNYRVLCEFYEELTNNTTENMKSFISNFFIGYLRRGGELSLETKIAIIKTLVNNDVNFDKNLLSSVTVSLFKIRADSFFYCFLKKVNGKINVISNKN